MALERAIARELRYEVGMADFTHRLLTDWSDGDQSEFPLGTQTALLESFLTHTRLLDEFLGGRPRTKPRSDDLFASMFVPEWVVLGFLSPDLREQTDRQLMHMTTHRRERRQWPIHAIARSMGSTVLAFTDFLSEEDQYELEGITIAARRLIDRADNSRLREIRLGLVWAESEPTDAVE